VFQRSFLIPGSVKANKVRCAIFCPWRGDLLSQKLYILEGLKGFNLIFYFCHHAMPQNRGFTAAKSTSIIKSSHLKDCTRALESKNAMPM
jgi:hypothetical protein